MQSSKMAGTALLVVCALFATVHADEVNEKDVLVLTADNFDDAVKEHSHLLVEFYAPWCGHCKKLKPEYATAATKLKQKGAVARLAKVDADHHKSLGSKFDIEGFPTLKWFVSGKMQEYGGGRTADEIVAWVTKKMGPPAVDIADVGELDKFTTDNELAVVGFFDSAESDEAKAFLESADVDENLEYGIVTNADLIASQTAGAPAIVAYRPEKKPHQSRTVRFTGDEYSLDKIREFASTHSLELVTEFSQETQPRIFGSHIKTQVLLFSDAGNKATAALKEEFTAAAAANSGKAIFVTVSGDNNGILEYFGIKKDELPKVFIVKVPASEQEGRGLLKYAHPDTAISTDSLNTLLVDFFAGDLKVHVKSEPAPAEQPRGVKVVVGTNFADIVMDKTKDVFLEFYAPWCGHCKKLEPIWAKLGQEFESVDTVTIAKMDATANDIPEDIPPVQGFPTLMLFNAKDKTPIPFQGDRSAKALKKFLKEKASQPFSLSAKKRKAGAM